MQPRLFAQSNQPTPLPPVGAANPAAALLAFQATQASALNKPAMPEFSASPARRTRVQRTAEARGARMRCASLARRSPPVATGRRGSPPVAAPLIVRPSGGLAGVTSPAVLAALAKQVNGEAGAPPVAQESALSRVAGLLACSFPPMARIAPVRLAEGPSQGGLSELTPPGNHALRRPDSDPNFAFMNPAQQRAALEAKHREKLANSKNISGWGVAKRRDDSDDSDSDSRDRRRRRSRRRRDRESRSRSQSRGRRRRDRDSRSRGSR